MQFKALPTPTVRALQRSGQDAYQQACERQVSDGPGNPCRHCLCDIPAGAEMLVLAHRPFEGVHAYAETGPIFLCAAECAQGGGSELPEVLTTSPDYLVKAYDTRERIIYGTGAIVPSREIPAYAATLFEDTRVDFIHVRSARNNCYQARIDRD